MGRALRTLGLLILAPFLACASGCFGLTQNPSYFPYLLPTGDVVRTHAKPISPGYYANFDPHAIRLEVRPLNATNQVQTKHVLIATVYDEKSQPRRNRRVEWNIQGEGIILEVDESGVFPGRGWTEGHSKAVSYTATHEHRFSRGTDNPNDDFMIRPGQTWCVITSAKEGDTHITVSAPGIHNWDKKDVFVTCRWVDATWEFPAPAAVRAGGEHVLTTKIFRHTDRQPLAGYRVRYKILDGPAAVLLPSRTTEYIATSDLNGNAQVGIAQAAPAFGVNRIAVEIIRPPDPTAPSGSGITIVKGETAIEWLAPNVTLSHSGPPLALLGQEAVFTTLLANNGRIESKSQTLTMPIPDGLQHVRSTPAAFVDGKNLVWALGALPPSQAHSIQTVFKALRQGSVTCCAAMTTEEGQKDEKCVTTNVSTASIRVSINAANSGVVGMPISYEIVVTNPSAAPLGKVDLTAVFDEGLEHETRTRNVKTTISNLGPQDVQKVMLILTPKQAGRFRTKVEAVSGNLSDQAIHEVVVQQAQMSLSVEGPSKRYQGKTADFLVKVGNPSDVPLTNSVVRHKLPLELEFVNASEGGRFAAGEVVWNLGVLKAREERILQVTAKCNGLSKSAVQVATVTADPGLRKDAQHAIEIFGMPALEWTELRAIGDPAEVGKKVTYVVKVTNTGTLPAADVELKAQIPGQMKLTDAKSPKGQPNLQGQILTFEKLNIEPRQTVEYRVETEALQAGSVIVRFQITSPSEEGGPIIRDQSTTIFDPNKKN